MPRSRGRRAPAPATARTPTPLDVAARILRVASRTEAELAARLVARGYQPETAAATVARCRELGWVGDAQLAHDRARALRVRGAGSLKIAADLEARGLSPAVVDAAVRASAEGEPESTWARRVLARAGDPTGAKAWRLLASRGFPEEVVTDVLGLLE